MPTTLDPRPSPVQVRAWLADALSDAALHAGLGVLAVDPNWRLRSIRASRAWDVDLLYSPEGARLAVHLRCRVPAAGDAAWCRVARLSRRRRPSTRRVIGGERTDRATRVPTSA